MHKLYENPEPLCRSPCRFNKYHLCSNFGTLVLNTLYKPGWWGRGPGVGNVQKFSWWSPWKIVETPVPARPSSFARLHRGALPSLPGPVARGEAETGPPLPCVVRPKKAEERKKENSAGKGPGGEGRTQYILGGYLRRKRHEQQIDGRPPGPEWVLRGPRTATSSFPLAFVPRPRDFVPVAPHCPPEMPRTIGQL